MPEKRRVMQEVLSLFAVMHGFFYMCSCFADGRRRFSFGPTILRVGNSCLEMGIGFIFRPVVGVVDHFQVLDGSNARDVLFTEVLVSACLRACCGVLWLEAAGNRQCWLSLFEKDRNHPLDATYPNFDAHR